MISAFTVVTKSYIPLATILSNSIKQVNPEIDFYCFVVDEPDAGLRNHAMEGKLLFIKELDLVKDYYDLAFKYNVTEFCTSVKPFCFEYLFKGNYDKIIYFDPDIYVFSNLNVILDKLDSFSFFLTPHITEPEINYSGIFQEGNFLKSGMFNLGFMALSNDLTTSNFLSWWKERLISKCYVDPMEGYFTDQKWIDFIPALFGNYYVEKSPAFNIAIWNLHERLLDFSNDHTRVKLRNKLNSDWESIVFIHYSNFNFHQLRNDMNFYPVELHRCIDFAPAVEFYKRKISESELLLYSEKYPYDFNQFRNGMPILKFHRRLYRRFSDINYGYDNPFTISDTSFYQVLKQQNLIVKRTKMDKISPTNGDLLIESKISVLHRFFMVAKFILGTSRYTLFCRFAVRFFRLENQYFLLGNFSDPQIKFLNDTSFVKNNA